MSLQAKFYQTAKVRPAKVAKHLEPKPLDLGPYANAHDASEALLDALCEPSGWWSLNRVLGWCSHHGLPDETGPVLLRMLTAEGFLEQDGERWKVRLL